MDPEGKGIALLRTELTPLDNTLSVMREATMQTYDIKKDRKDLYAPRAGGFEIVEVPPLDFLMVDGHGDPNTSIAYHEAIEALYGASYSVRSVAKARLGKLNTIGPLEGLWSADDLTAFRKRDKSAWDWTMMIAQPEWVTAALVEEALSAARKKRLPALGLIRLEHYAEGRSVQILHVGAYDDEGPTLERLHRDFLPASGFVPRGRHHEIYLSDARRTEPARLKTILRQPVSKLTAASSAAIGKATN
ncbi:MAG: GyrI-like domain-containing protein [Acidimicrobiales bacterium]